MIVLVVGGTRSGKSEVAERIARKLDEPVTFVGIGTSSDPEIAARIEAHRARRPSAWRTVECEDHDVALVETVAKLEGTVLIDSLGTWVARAPEMRVDADGLVAAVRRRSGPTVIVSEEVGLAVHAPTEAGRRFADSLGLLNAAVAAVADRVLLVVAGRAVSLAAGR